MAMNILAIAGNFFLFIEVLESFQVVCCIVVLRPR